MSEILATKTDPGQYGMTRSSKLVCRKGKHYLVHDQFCGMDSLEGGSYRPFVFAVPDEMVQEIKTLYAKADEFVDPSRPDLGTNWDYFLQDGITKLNDCGRASKLSWAKDL